jgi:hypothetical protein
MPITCPCCNSECVVVVCRTAVEYIVEGDLCAEQDWIPMEVLEERGEVAHAECKDCHQTLGVVMVGESLAALTQQSAAGDLEPEAVCPNCGGVGCHACLRPAQS